MNPPMRAYSSRCLGWEYGTGTAPSSTTSPFASAVIAGWVVVWYVRAASLRPASVLVAWLRSVCRLLSWDRWAAEAGLADSRLICWRSELMSCVVCAICWSNEETVSCCCSSSSLARNCRKAAARALARSTA